MLSTAGLLWFFWPAGKKLLLISSYPSKVSSPLFRLCHFWTSKRISPWFHHFIKALWIMIKATGCHADWNKVLPAPRTLRRPRCSSPLCIWLCYTGWAAGWATGWLALYCRLWTIIMYIAISKWDDPHRQYIPPQQQQQQPVERARGDSPRLNCIIEWCDLRALFISIYSLHIHL